MDGVRGSTAHPVPARSASSPVQTRPDVGRRQEMHWRSPQSTPHPRIRIAADALRRSLLLPTPVWHDLGPEKSLGVLQQAGRKEKQRGQSSPYLLGGVVRKRPWHPFCSPGTLASKCSFQGEPIIGASSAPCHRSARTGSRVRRIWLRAFPFSLSPAG